MSARLSVLLPRAAAIVLIGLGATATLTYAAGRNIDSTTPTAATTATTQGTVTVPDVQGQAFVFAKSALADAGFAWRVTGSVHGYAANTVVSQTPAPGAMVLDTGAPLVTLTLKRNARYAQAGQAEDVSPYLATPAQPSALAARPATAAAPAKTMAAPKTAAPKTAAPKTAAPKTQTPAQKSVAAPKTAAPKAAPTPKTAARPVAFVVAGAQKEPLDEMPLPDRATLLGTWLAAHAKPTNANVAHWLYQNEWIVAGAKMGWWRGAEALRTLIAVDKRAQSQWGIGARSAVAARAALSYVEARSKP
jgi:hypothetical protein